MKKNNDTVAAWGCFIVAVVFAIWGMAVLGGIVVKLTKWALSL